MLGNYQEDAQRHQRIIDHAQDHRQEGGGAQGGAGGRGSHPPPPASPKGTLGAQALLNKPARTTQPTQSVRNPYKATDLINRALQTQMYQNDPFLISVLQEAQECIQGLLPNYQAFQREVQEFHQALKATAQTPKSYAQTAAATAPMQIPTQRAPAQSTEILVRIGDQEERRAMQDLPNKAIAERLGIREVVAVHKLSSGDVKIFAAGEKARGDMMKDTTWAKKLGASAQPAQEQHQVLIHGVPIPNSTDDVNSAEYRLDIQRQQHRHIPGLQITQASWLKSPKAREGKKASSLVVSVLQASMAQAIIQKGFVLDFGYHIAEAYSPQHRATQCLNCSTFGHTAKYCRAPAKCGACAGAHATRDCKETKRKCSNCQGSHASWSGVCKIKQAAKAKAASAKAWAMKAATAAISTWPHHQDQTEWTQVGYKRQRGYSPDPEGATRQPSQVREPRAPRRAGPGRPRAITTAAQAPGQSSMHAFTGSQSIGQAATSSQATPQDEETEQATQEDSRMTQDE